MVRFFSWIVPVLAAMGLLVATFYLSENPGTLRTAYTGLTNCDSTEALCTSWKDALRGLGDASYDIARSHLAKEELPLLRIFMPDAALAKLDAKRKETLSRPGKKKILLTEPNDWVKATVITDDGHRERKVSVSLRLKGDWADHLQHPKKLSFRIKTRKGGYIFGMKRLSIQHPVTRKYHLEPMLLDQMRDNGILAPRYFFVDVRINEYKIGVMALEEHFSKELLENQSRREGPILALNEDLIWRQRALNYVDGRLNNTPEINPDAMHYKMRDLPVKEFRAPAFKSGTIRTNNSIRGQSLLGDFLNGEADGTEVFDVKQISRWWVITNMWGSCHGAILHNSRYYFNTITNLLEPISFDNSPRVREYDKRCDNDTTRALMGDSAFLEATIVTATKLVGQLGSQEFRDAFEAKQTKLLALLKLDGMEASKVEVNDLRRNLRTFLLSLQTAKGSDKLDNRLSQGDGIAHRKLQSVVTELATHLRTFAIYDGEKTRLEIKNLTIHPIVITQVEYRVDSGGRIPTSIESFTLPSYKQGSRAHIQTIGLEPPEQFPKDAMVVVSYRFDTRELEQTADFQYREHFRGLRNDFETRAASISPAIMVDRKSRSILFPPGAYTISESYELPVGWSITLMPNVTLNLAQGALIKLRGPLYALGTAKEPIKVNIESRPDFRFMGAWGGLLISQSEARSVVTHTDFVGHSSLELGTRQDYYGMTGCISFYESDIRMESSRFLRLQCEDALNIVRSRFTLDEVEIRAARADAFDSDFSEGVVRNSSFISSGNDGIDISGTTLELESSRFHSIGDKAISVGERSNLTARGVTVNGASTGIASKDLSRVVIERSTFRNISGTVLIAYIKKVEYGPAAIECFACTTEDVGALSASQAGSEIMLDGARLPVADFSRSQMAEAGYTAL